METECNCPPDAGRLHQAIVRGQTERVRQFLLEAGPGASGRHNLDQGLMIACLRGHAAVVRLLLEAGADVDARGKDLWTPLMHAARGRDPQVIRLLLDYGADVHAVNSYGRTALIEAAWDGSADAVRVLAEAGSDLDHCPAEVGGPALAEAMWNNNTEAFLVLLEAGANLEVRDRQGTTPLQWAAGRGHEAIVARLLRSGRDIEAVTNTGTRPLILAAAGGYANIVRLLLEAGAKVNARDSSGKTALHWGAWRDPEIARLLVRAGADVNSAASDHTTPVCVAAMSGCLETLRFLLDHGGRAQPLRRRWPSALEHAAIRGDVEKGALILESPDVDPDYRSRLGRTALIAAAAGGHVDFVDLLLKRGANPSLADERGDTAAILAASVGSLGILELLEKAGADLVGSAPGGRTPLAAAIQGGPATGQSDGPLPLLRWLLEHGADIDGRSRDRTPLMLAVESGRASVIEELIARGADVNAETESGWTPLQSAAAEGDGDERRIRPTERSEDRMAPIVEMLLQAGADPAPGGSTRILAHAAANRCPEVVEVLVKAGAPVDTEDQAEPKPLLRAVGNLRVLRFLLQQGADPNGRERGGQTALHRAAGLWRPCPDQLRALVQKGADINARCGFGNTPLLVAVQTNVQENVEELVRLGADLAAANRIGETALAIARKNDQPGMVRILEETPRPG